MGTYHWLTQETQDETMITVPALADYSRILFSQIDGNLWIGGCPVESLPREFGFVLDLYGQGEYHVTGRQIRTLAPMLDSAAMPDERYLHMLARHVNECRLIGPTLVHCAAGQNRSGLVAGLALVLAGWTAGSAIALMRERRSAEVLSNKTFEGWLRQQVPPAVRCGRFG